jgi:hypothetical protein
MPQDYGRMMLKAQQRLSKLTSREWMTWTVVLSQAIMRQLPPPKQALPPPVSQLAQRLTVLHVMCTCGASVIYAYMAHVRIHGRVRTCMTSSISCPCLCALFAGFLPLFQQVRMQETVQVPLQVSTMAVTDCCVGFVCGRGPFTGVPLRHCWQP